MTSSPDAPWIRIGADADPWTDAVTDSE